MFGKCLEDVVRVSGGHLVSVWNESGMKVSTRFLECNRSLPRKCFKVFFESVQVKSGQDKSRQVKSEQAKLRQVVKTGQVKSGQIESGQVKSGHVKSRQVKL